MWYKLAQHIAAIKLTWAQCSPDSALMEEDNDVKWRNNYLSHVLFVFGAHE